MADTYPNYKPLDLRVIHDRVSLWEAKTDPKAPLTSEQKNLLHDLGCIATHRPLPKNLPEDDAQSLTHARVTLQDKEKTEDTSGLSSFMKETKLPYSNKIENAQQFFSWFSELEESLERDDGGLYRQYTYELTQYKDQCSNVLAEVSKALEYLQQLNNQYIHVATKTNALHEECEHLLAEQTHLMDLAESISNKLSYFNELDSISTKLSRPNLNVSSETFIPLLSRMDECILYLKSNPRYKECDVYLARFRQCLNKALSLIKSHVTNILMTATQQIQPKKDSPNMADNAFTLFYGKFRANAPRVKALTEQLELRTEKDNEYASALADCQTFYFTQRETLLGPSISTTMSDLASKHVRDHCALMRSGCAFMVHVCEDEYQLYFNFFSKATPLLDAMLERICNNLYDVFRPLLIHINHLETLSELCSIIKIEMMEEHVKQNPQELAAFESICQQLLMDIQERLVYRTYIYIKSDILQYNAAPGDLAYPEKLEMMESIAESIKKGKPPKKVHSRTPSNASSTSQEVAMLTGAADNSIDSSFASNGSGKTVDGEDENELQEVPLDRSLDDTSSNMPMSPADFHGMWYPTVRRALVTLSKLYRCIDKTTFQGLSQEALQACITSLRNAKDGIVKRKQSTLDGELFLIKHLLILREQIAPFQADFSIRETHLDFSKFKDMTGLKDGSLGLHTLVDAAYSLFNKKSQLFSLSSNNALLQFILEGTPQVTELFVDSKRDVDQQLKTSCEDFIHHVTELFVAPLQSFMSRASVITSMKKEDAGTKITLRQQPFALPEKVHDVVTETYKNIKTKLPIVQRSMSLYLANKDTEAILFRPIKVNVQQTFQKFHDLITQEYSEEDILIIACPSTEQVNLLVSTRMSSTPKK
ncbi:conserved oligomeric Golgi complex subunit 3-like isoform X1 [Biomphalaria pfeifferi]|uniref:Conserved oligomeric Golgi complex subunit 3 n=1 Tax=Biomphalaria pfeifferi TaxID=112525 RepID=A0AAD8BTG5_BIOPF|nr:conserved oligomeric Golgi complex subunit 3-like isoform X1 [Biomphalaria pfeifferi]